ncbi:ankyrin repeat domain-containing protein [Hoeflea poritis]|uniref:Ankyrin repeat domain-containing protein n=1 Tax=Hoeflea poritis TaxID=2993659 RepID=A0ABT4VH29_9HYPH|nr:ankyrin repeat domain-containing protein [Hoeflea poritis]MDA4844003.1 hypothetical protein [Hoeflea poritis]
MAIARSTIWQIAAAMVVTPLLFFAPRAMATEAELSTCEIESVQQAGDAIRSALRGKRYDVIHCFVESGYDINSTALFGETLLDRVVSYGYLELVEYLLARGAALNLSERPTITSAITGLGVDLHDIAKPDGEPFSSLEDHFGVLRSLLENGAQLDERFEHGTTTYIVLIMDFCDREWHDRIAYYDFLDDISANDPKAIEPTGPDNTAVRNMWLQVAMGHLDEECVERSFKSFRVANEREFVADE